MGKKNQNKKKKEIDPELLGFKFESEKQDMRPKDVPRAYMRKVNERNTIEPHESHLILQLIKSFCERRVVYCSNCGKSREVDPGQVTIMREGCNKVAEQKNPFPRLSAQLLGCACGGEKAKKNSNME